MKRSILIAIAATALLFPVSAASADDGGRPITVQMTPLNPPTNGSSSGCAPATRALAKEPIQTPDAFYVNVHDMAFPGGAVRGQLSR